MVKLITRERGAALITVLLFVVLVFILITAMLSVSGNEVVIAGLQRDSVRATELAQAGLQEAIARIAAGHLFTVPLYSVPFNSLTPTPCPAGPCVTVTVTQVYAGTNSSYLEIDATASQIGRATRKLTALVLRQVIAFPPDITFAYSVTQQGSASINCGDAYAQTFLQYKSYPTQGAGCTNPPTLSYTAWRTSKVNPGPINPCYTNADCIAQNPGNADVARWWPGTRRTTPATSTLGNDIGGFEANAKANSCVATNPSYATTVPIGAILANDPTQTGILTAIPQYGFDTDTPPGAQSQLTAALFSATTGSPPPLCGLPYKWVSETFKDENNVVQTRWFKTIIFDEWFKNYWRFDETQMTEVKRGNGSGTQPCVDNICVKVAAGDPAPTVQPDLLKYPQFGAVPPFPDTSSIMSNYDCTMSGGGVINSLPVTCQKADGSTTTSDLGFKNPEMGTSPDRPVLFVLNTGSWQINGNVQGHGTLVVNGDLVVNGTFTYWGTIVVTCDATCQAAGQTGTLQAGTGNVTVYGGLVAQSTLQLIGNITVNGGGTVTNVPTGQSLVFGRAWWER